MDNCKQMIDSLLKETTRMDFPFLSSESKKISIINDKRDYINKTFKKAYPDKSLREDYFDTAWNSAVRHADKEFSNLPDSKKFNGFYLQELMHEYVVNLIDIITNKGE